MVDENKVNQVDDSAKGRTGSRPSSSSGGTDASVGPRPVGTTEAGPAGWELPLLLFAGFRTLIDRTHETLARQGHPGLRPAHGFALQAVGPDGATAGEIARRLGVSKQAAGKTVDRLAELGYADRTTDPADARRKLVTLTPHGVDALHRSAACFAALRADWAAALGPERIRDLEDALRQVAAPDSFRLDAAGWMNVTP